MSRPRLIALLLMLITLAIYLPAASNGFLNFDDDEYITANPVVRSGLTLAGLQWACTSECASNWHPVTWLSHMTDCSLFGLNAHAHHFVNVLFHSANAALLFILLRRLTGRLWAAALVAALFAWHPLRVESVAWVSERKDVLSAFFALLTMLAYAKYAMSDARRATSGKPAGVLRGAHWASRFYGFSLLFFALGLMSKPMLVTLPFGLLLFDYWPLRGISNLKFQIADLKWLIREKTPFFLLSAISCLVTYVAQSRGEAIVSLARIPLSHRLENAPVAAAGYLQKIFFPAKLCVLYPMPDSFAPLAVGLSFAVLISISIAAWRWRGSKPYFIVGWLWFLGSLVPVLGLVQVGGQAMADRYTYSPSIGLFLALVFLAVDFVDRIATPKFIRFGLAGAILGACILTTENQLRFWRDSETLFRRAIAVTENNTVALINLGVALESQDRFDEALALYRQAEQTGHQRHEIHNNLGHALDRLNRHAEALIEYQAALRLRPDNATLHNSVGSELAALNRFDDALAEFSKAEALNPHYAAPHVEAAAVLFKIGHDSEGVEEFRTALRMQPDNFKTLATTAHFLAANENAPARDGKAALNLALKADELSDHTEPLVLDILGMAYAETGDFSNAVLSAQNALTLAEVAQLGKTNDFRLRLELYNQNRPWRESFRSTNAPANH